MASRAVSVILALAAPALLGGCATMIGNLGGLSYNSLGRAGHHLAPYGGVKICLEAGTESCREVVYAVETGRVGAFLGATWMLGLDLPLCAVADTLTLPLTISALLKGESKINPVRWWGNGVRELRWWGWGWAEESGGWRRGPSFDPNYPAIAEEPRPPPDEETRPPD